MYCVCRKLSSVRNASRTVRGSRASMRNTPPRMPRNAAKCGPCDELEPVAAIRATDRHGQRVVIVIVT
jgi:hypothetical protein